jgi:hypothetical protein
VYGLGQAHLRDDHLGSKYKYNVYKEDPPYVEGKDNEVGNGKEVGLDSCMLQGSSNK